MQLSYHHKVIEKMYYQAVFYVHLIFFLLLLWDIYFEKLFL